MLLCVAVVPVSLRLFRLFDFDLFIRMIPKLIFLTATGVSGSNWCEPEKTVPNPPSPRLSLSKSTW
jgi:hypothetical protein